MRVLVGEGGLQGWVGGMASGTHHRALRHRLQEETPGIIG